ncbi:hypothetical protein C5167_015812 [Papaver somniferum]|uniref:Uncharacterized protein n=1 Tax=Papaver somniferum TaxID=3469 RepID=A0A4Y7J906_PAPSO|nr:hypothetical protein C5167_015812 [Papaver somniferum]
MGNSKVFMGILINFRKRYAQAFHGKLESTMGILINFRKDLEQEIVKKVFKIKKQKENVGNR